jgi:hypothetical protein
MPAYGYLQWGDCGTIVNPQMTVDYLTVAGPASDFPFDVQLESNDPCDAAYRQSDGSYKRFVSPDVDPAPWYDASMGANDVNASAQFLGLIISKVEGLEDSTAAREMTPRAVGVGGGSLGPLRMNGRTMRFTATMYATSCRGMDFGMRWLSNTLRGRPCSADDTCTLQVWTGCPDVSNILRVPEDVQWVLRDVALSEGPKYGDAPFDGSFSGPTSCYVREVEWTLLSEHPYLFKCPSTAVAYSALSAPVSGKISILQWLKNAHQVNLYVDPVDAFGEELVTLELTAGDKPLSCDVRGWISPFPNSCSSLEAPTISKVTNPNGLSPWLYEVNANGTWSRFQLSDDGTKKMGTAAASGSGPMYGSLTPGASGTYRDIRVSLLGAVTRTDNLPGLAVAGFHDCTIIGGEVNQNAPVPTYSSGISSAIGVRATDWTGTLHAEGLYVKGTALHSGFTLGSTGTYATAQFKNCRIEDPRYISTASKNGGTGIYVGSKLFNVSADGVSIKRTRKYGVRIAPTDGYSMAASGGYVTDVILRRVNVDTDTGGDSLVRHPIWIGAYSTATTGVYTRSTVRLSDYWGQVSNGYEEADDFIVSTVPASGYPYTSVVDTKGRTVLTWASASRVDGAAYRGLPGTGDFVPAARVGATYPALPLLDDEDACATYYIRGLPAGYLLTIDPSTQRITARDKAGVIRDGSAYVQLPEKKAMSWLVFDCQPLCLNIDQPYAGSGDGAAIKVTRTHREV